MEKQTKAQRSILSGNEMLSTSAITGNVWSNDGRFSFKVNRRTFDVLLGRGLYAPYKQGGSTLVYARTDLGRAALEASNE